MLSFLSLVLYVTVIPAGLVLGTTAERLALLVVSVVLLLRLWMHRHSATGAPTHRVGPAAAERAPREVLAQR